MVVTDRLRSVMVGFVAKLFVASTRASAEEPSIVVTDDVPRLELPSGLTDYLETVYSDWRVPNESDFTHQWSELVGPTGLPFAAWGDVDGNGLADSVIILLRVDEWRAVTFLQVAEATYTDTPLRTASDLGEGYYSQPPQQFAVDLLGAGESLTFGGEDISWISAPTDQFLLWDLRPPESVRVYQWDVAMKDYSGITHIHTDDQ